MPKRTNIHVALCSGGMDSAVATHAVMNWGPGDLVVYLDTRTGLDDNRKYVEELCDAFDWYMATFRTPVSYEKRVREHGFPGPSRHNMYYRLLKERQLHKLATLVRAGQDGGTLHLWTGVRSDESRQRLERVEHEQDGNMGRWTWKAPIHEWTKQDCEQYIDHFDIPRNPLWDTLGRSGDCYCGCFGTREELIDLAAAGHEGHVERLMNIERAIDDYQEKGSWAWASIHPGEIELDDLDMTRETFTLCSNCGVFGPYTEDQPAD